MPGANEIKSVLEEFVRDVNNTDGVWMDHKGNPRPMADPNWIDLGFTYLKACAALGINPVYSTDEPDDWC